MRFNKKTSPLHKLSSVNGVSMIELMIIIVVSLLIGLGVVSMMSNMLVTQERVKTVNSMDTFLINLEKLLRNPRAWDESVAAGVVSSTGLNCMDDDPTTLCDHVPAPPHTNLFDDPPPAGNGPFIVYDEGPTNALGDGQVFYDATDPTNGFDLTGAPCNTYDAGAGNDDCPFRYDLTWFADCPNMAPTCNRPQVTVVARFRNNPASKGLPRFRINSQGLNFYVRVGERMNRSSFIVSQFETGQYAGPAPVIGFGGGACVDNTLTRRPLNTFQDPGDGIMSFDDAGDLFQLDIGRYFCTITAQAYSARSGVKIYLADTTLTHNYLVGNGFSNNGSTTTIRGTVAFELQAPRWFEVLHLTNSCDLISTGASHNEFAMGIPVATNYAGMNPTSYTGGTTFTSVSCTREY